MTVALVTYTDPFSTDGLGQSSQLGVAFVKKVNVTLSSPDVAATITAAELGASKIYGVLSIVQKTVDVVYVSAQTETSVTLTAAANTAVFDVYVLCAGL